MSENMREVRKYAWRGYISNQLRQGSAIDVERMLQVDLERQAQAEGYVMLPGTFEVRYFDPADSLDPSDPDVAWAAQHDMAIVLTSLQCYAAEDSE